MNAVRRMLDQVREGLEGKIGGLDTKVVQVPQRLDTKIDKNQAETNAGIAKVIDEISKIRADMAGLRGMQKAMLWMMGGTGGVALAVGLATLGKMFHWF